jgi:hypothetical protein
MRVDSKVAQPPPSQEPRQRSYKSQRRPRPQPYSSRAAGPAQPYSCKRRRTLSSWQQCRSRCRRS